jgi:hypothetical protein
VSFSISSVSSKESSAGFFSVIFFLYSLYEIPNIIYI